MNMKGEVFDVQLRAPIPLTDVDGNTIWADMITGTVEPIAGSTWMEVVPFSAGARQVGSTTKAVYYRRVQIDEGHAFVLIPAHNILAIHHMP